jgi:hypothetical protein
MPCLPPHLWTPILFKMIGDAMGKYVDVYFSYKITKDMYVTHILVLLDFREGFAPEIFLNTVYRDVVQNLDYEGVPLRCHHCHSMDHLMAQCDRPFRWNMRTDGQKDWTREEGASKKSRSLSSVLSLLHHL